MVTDFEGSQEFEIPDTCVTEEEIQQFLLQHQPTIKSITYYPKFGVYSLLDIYDAKTKVCEVYDYEYTDARRFSKNPEAADMWNNMLYLSDIGDSLVANSDSSLTSSILPQLETIDFVPSTKLDFWKTCISNNEYNAANASIDEYYWQMANQLAELDKDEKHRLQFTTVISEKARNTLSMLVSHYDYSGFEIPINLIRWEKMYLAQPDPQWYEKSLSQFVSFMNSN